MTSYFQNWFRLELAALYRKKRALGEFLLRYRGHITLSLPLMEN